MSCSDPRFQSLIADAAIGRLTPGEAFQLRSHLRNCQSCQELLRAGALLARKSVEEVLKEATRHISEAELSDYYLGSSATNPDRQSQIENHLRSCPECKGELDFLEDVERQFRHAAQAAVGQPTAVVRRESAWKRLLWNPAVAYALFLIAAVPAIWLAQEPETRQQNAAADVTQAIEIRETARSAGEAQVIQRRSPDQYLRLQFPYPHLAAKNQYRLSVVPEASVSYWLDFSKPGIIDAIVFTGNLADGRLTFVLSEIATDDPTDSLLTPFEIRLETTK